MHFNSKSRLYSLKKIDIEKVRILDIGGLEVLQRESRCMLVVAGLLILVIVSSVCPLASDSNRSQDGVCPLGLDTSQLADYEEHDRYARKIYGLDANCHSGYICD